MSEASCDTRWVHTCLLLESLCIWIEKPCADLSDGQFPTAPNPSGSYFLDETPDHEGIKLSTGSERYASNEGYVLNGVNMKYAVLLYVHAFKGNALQEK